MNAVVLLINLPVQVLCDQWDQRIIRVFVGYLDSMGRQVCHLQCWHLHRGAAALD